MINWRDVPMPHNIALLPQGVRFQGDRLLQVVDAWSSIEWWKDGEPFTNSEKIRYALHRAENEMRQGKRKKST